MGIKLPRLLSSLASTLKLADEGGEGNEGDEEGDGEEDDDNEETEEELKAMRASESYDPDIDEDDPAAQTAHDTQTRDCVYLHFRLPSQNERPDGVGTSVSGCYFQPLCLWQPTPLQSTHIFSRSGAPCITLFRTCSSFWLTDAQASAP